MRALPRPRVAFLGSRFGRRLFVMFCIAALAPAAIVFWMTYRTAATDAREARLQALRTSSKDFGLGVYTRLRLADDALGAADPGAVAGGRPDHFLALYFIDVSVAGDSQQAGAGKRSAAPAPEAAERLQISAAGMESAVRLRRVVRGRTLVGTLRPSYLWGAPDDMAGDVRICVFAGGSRLFCGGHPGTDAGDTLVLATWELFLRATFDVEPWTVVSVAGSGHGLSHYSGVIAPAAVAVLLFAMLLSSVQIRRVLVPLAMLMRSIRRFQGRGRVVAARAGEDEFGVLSRSFAEMQQRIGRQMGTLRTLADADRLILAGAPLAELVDLVIRHMQRDFSPLTACVAVSAADARDDVVLFVRHAGQEISAQVACPAAGALPDAGAEGRWFDVDDLPAAVRDAVAPGGARDFLVLAPGGDSACVRVLLGFADRSDELDEPLAQAAEVAEAIPVAVAFEQRKQQLVFQAHHDSLTRLPNRLASVDAVTAAIEAAGQPPRRFAVAFLDLDRFKSINDALGHAFGDELLVGVAGRLRENLSQADFVGRFGGDEFCIVLTDAADPAAAQRAMARVAEGFSRPVIAGGREILQRFSAGIAFYPDHGSDANMLIRNADVAMYHGKRSGGHLISVFAPEMNAEAIGRLRMENDLREAIDAGAIEVHYQPRVDSSDGRIVGAEALARWTHPESGPVSPAVFIPLAEDCGLIDELGELVLRKACRQLAAWKASGLELPLVAVNISGRQLRSDRLVSVLAETIESSGLVPAEIEIEITETMLVYDYEAGDLQLRRIRDLGVSIAIDDFGTGYSSLSYLAKLPYDTLKIDRSFVLGIESGDVAAAAIVRSIIAMANELGKDLVAEGVESMTEVALLSGWGCNVIQGYVYHRPLTADGMGEVLRAAGAARR